MKTYTYDRTDQPGQYQITLTDTGRTGGGYGKQRVAFTLSFDLHNILFQGDDLFVALGQDPEGPQSASDVLAFFLAAEATKGKDDYYDLETWESDLSEEAEALRNGA